MMLRLAVAAFRLHLAGSDVDDKVIEHFIRSIPEMLERFRGDNDPVAQLLSLFAVVDLSLFTRFDLEQQFEDTLTFAARALWRSTSPEVHHAVVNCFQHCLVEAEHAHKDLAQRLLSEMVSPFARHIPRLVQAVITVRYFSLVHVISDLTLTLCSSGRTCG